MGPGLYLWPEEISGAATVDVTLGSCGERSRLAGVTRQGGEETGRNDASAGLPVQPRAAFHLGFMKETLILHDKF